MGIVWNRSNLPISYNPNCLHQGIGVISTNYNYLDSDGNFYEAIQFTTSYRTGENSPSKISNGSDT